MKPTRGNLVVLNHVRDVCGQSIPLELKMFGGQMKAAIYCETIFDFNIVQTTLLKYGLEWCASGPVMINIFQQHKEEPPIIIVIENNSNKISYRNTYYFEVVNHEIYIDGKQQPVDISVFNTSIDSIKEVLVTLAFLQDK